MRTAFFFFLRFLRFFLARRCAVAGTTAGASLTLLLLDSVPASKRPLMRHGSELDGDLLSARRRRGAAPAFKPSTLAVQGPGTAQRFHDALAWFKAVLLAGISAPLAPRLDFPTPGSEGCAFAFVRVARRARGDRRRGLRLGVEGVAGPVLVALALLAQSAACVCSSAGVFALI